MNRLMRIQLDTDNDIKVGQFFVGTATLSGRSLVSVVLIIFWSILLINKGMFRLVLIRICIGWPGNKNI